MRHSHVVLILLLVIVGAHGAPAAAEETPTEACYACIEGIGCAQTPFDEFGQTACRRRCEQFCAPNGECAELCVCVTSGGDCAIPDIPTIPDPGSGPTVFQDPNALKSLELFRAIPRVELDGTVRRSLVAIDPQLAVLVGTLVGTEGNFRGTLSVEGPDGASHHRFHGLGGTTGNGAYFHVKIKDHAGLETIDGDFSRDGGSGTLLWTDADGDIRQESW